MSKVVEQVKALERASGLSLAQLERQVGVPSGVLSAFVEGGPLPTPSVIERCATLAGLETDEFLRGASVDSAPLALLRSAHEARVDLLEEYRREHTALLCGELLRSARMVQRIEAALGVSRSGLPSVPRSPIAAWAHPAEEDARRARVALRLPDEPIPSMRALLERHGVLVVWTDEDDDVPDTLDGLSLAAPIPTVLVNLRHGRDRVWHTRMTLAHELAHLLFDHLRRGVDVVRSPSNGEGIDEVERNANAFAACFLAPAHLVRAAVGALAPDSVEAVKAVGARFGVGRTVAINRLQHVFRLSDSTRDEMEDRARGVRYTGVGREDAPDLSEIGLRRGTYRLRVLEAYRQSKLPRSRVWSLLGLSPNESLDAPALTDEQRRPLRPVEDQMLDRAHALLLALVARSGEAAAWTPSHAAKRDDGRWTITLLRTAGAPDADAPTLTLDADGALVAFDAKSDAALSNLLRASETRA